MGSMAHDTGTSGPTSTFSRAGSFLWVVWGSVSISTTSSPPAEGKIAGSSAFFSCVCPVGEEGRGGGQKDEARNGEDTVPLVEGSGGEAAADDEGGG